MSPRRRDADLRYWLALHRTPGIGARRFAALLDVLGEPAEIFSESVDSLRRLGLRPDTVTHIKSPDWTAVDDDLAWLDDPQHHCVTVLDEAYPPLLKEIPDRPALLFVHGDCAAIARRQLAIVGSRNPSTTGSQLANEFARALARHGFAITSGLALGIDTAAHRGALDAGGITLAVAGTGLDQVYPARNQALADELVAKGGALVSEFPTRTPPQASNFPRRNRIISGLAVGSFVVEAALRSGSLITARMALEQGREVFALPGSIHNPLSRGCNSLIKQGAKLVETVDDIIDELGGLRSPSKPDESRDEAVGTDVGGHHAVLKFVAYNPTSVDTLVAATGFAPEAIASMLLVLELEGYVQSTGGGYCRLK